MGGLLKLPPQVPELGPPLPGDLGPAIVPSQQRQSVATYAAPGEYLAEAERLARQKEAGEAAASSVFFRSGTPATAPSQTPSAPATDTAAFDPLAAGPASTAAQSVDPTAAQNRQHQKAAFLKLPARQ